MTTRELYVLLELQGLAEKELRIKFRDKDGEHDGYDEVGAEDYDYLYFDAEEDVIYL